VAERVMKGSRLGALSYETEGGAEVAPRALTRYVCSDGHESVVPFAAEAEIPGTWECRTCRRPAQRADVPVADAVPGKKPRTHWDMLLERRTFADLELVLAERLDVLRGSASAKMPSRRRKTA
jgi:hypothetical protein